MTSLFQIVGDYYITAPTHKLAQLMSSRNIPVYLYNYEYKSVLAPWEGEKRWIRTYEKTQFVL